MFNNRTTTSPYSTKHIPTKLNFQIRTNHHNQIHQIILATRAVKYTTICQTHYFLQPKPDDHDVTTYHKPLPLLTRSSITLQDAATDPWFIINPEYICNNYYNQPIIFISNCHSETNNDGINHNPSNLIATNRSTNDDLIFPKQKHDEYRRDTLYSGVIENCNRKM